MLADQDGCARGSTGGGSEPLAQQTRVRAGPRLRRGAANTPRTGGEPPCVRGGTTEPLASATVGAGGTAVGDTIGSIGRLRSPNMAEAPREVHWLAWAAVASGVLGLVSTYSGVDPWPYVGVTLIFLAPIPAICAFVRSRDSPPVLWWCSLWCRLDC